jgi:hypothetical protein
MIPLAQAQAVVPDLQKLTPDQFAWVEQLVHAMSQPSSSWRNPTSDVFTDDRVMGLFFLFLVTHHTLSSEAFKQEKFEYALEKILNQCGRIAARAPSRTNPGHDLTVDGVKWSLKTVADKSVKSDPILLTKWMELGKGTWGKDVEDLKALCKKFVAHLAGYDRVFVLRYMTPGSTTNHEYEVIEIPKSILLSAPLGDFQLSARSELTTATPGTCRVSDAAGMMYELYFDGGTERKLQLKKLRRDLCVHHATWKFQSPEPKPEASAGE